MRILQQPPPKRPRRRLERLLLHVDAEVLKLYSLPLDLEQRVLGLFSDRKRVGVPFKQTNLQ